MKTSFRAPKPLEWTPDLVANFWDYWANSPELHDQYFTFQAGEAITKFLSCVTDLRERRVLDYGCGPGFLEEHLLAHCARVTAADYSTEAVRTINERFAGRDGWEGVASISNGAISADDDTFDIVMCIETIEHMFEADRKKMLSEFRRVLKPGGFVMISTPNEENLQRNSVLCPQCGNLFHMMQHLHSWSKESLTRVLTEADFNVSFCEGLSLNKWMSSRRRRLIDCSIRDFKNTVFDIWSKALDCIHPKPFPRGRFFRRLLRVGETVHLIAVAVKP